MDTRNLGRPSQFNGTDSAWRDWSVVFRSYAALVHPALKEEMQRVERLPTAETHAGLLDDEQVQASSDYTFICTFFFTKILSFVTFFLLTFHS